MYQLNLGLGGPQSKYGSFASAGNQTIFRTPTYGITPIPIELPRVPLCHNT